MSDEEIRHDVRDELDWDARVRPHAIDVAVASGVVTLSGSVDSFLKKWQAEELALRVRGVRAVANEVEVRLAAGDERTDEDIARAATQALDCSFEVPGSVRVTVDHGRVTLRGEVEWQHERQAAQRAVRNLVGVEDVIDRLTIAPKLQPHDLKRQIEQAIRRTAEVDADNIHVDAHEGRVVLTGRVRSWFEKQEVEREAWLAPGVREVVDELEIRST